MSHLPQSLYAFIPDGLLLAAQNMTGENESRISAAMHSILPSILKGIMVSNTPDHAAIGDLLTQAGSNDNLLTELNTDIQNSNRSSLGLNNGKHFIQVLLGNKTSGVENLVANHSGVSPDDAHLLLSIGGAITASFLGKKMIGEGLNFNGILTWLNSHRAETDLALPQDFSGFLQDQNVHASSSSSGGSEYAAISNEEEVKNDGMKWLMPILLIGFLGFGIWYWLKGCNQKDPETVQSEQVESSIDHAADSAVNALNMVEDTNQMTPEIVDTISVQDTLAK